MNRADFWKLYLQEHSQQGTRWLHTIGTLAGWVLLFAACYFRSWWLALLGPVIGYGFAWSSHVLIERNRPLSMRYPVRSLLADNRLTLLMLLFQPLEQDSGEAAPKGQSL